MSDRLKRLPGVDVIRGLCIFAVVIHHINLRIRFNKSPLGAALPDQVHRILFWNGSYAVKVFFVVSGFLITSTILARWKTRTAIDLKGFYRLRAARIAPLLLAILTILSVLHLASAPGFTINAMRASLPRALIAALTFHVNWLEPRHGYLPGAWDVLWSLSVEEAFYLAYPLLCRYVKRGWILGILALLLMAAGPLFRTVWAFNEIDSDYAYLANLDCIALGCAAALLGGRIRAPRWIGPALMIAVTFVKSGALAKSGFDVTVLALGTASTLISLQRKPSAGRWTSPLQWLGRNSYEVYLTHMFVVTTATEVYTAVGSPIRWALAWFLGITAVSALLGDAVARWYSEPLNRKLRQAARSEQSVSVVKANA
jgi:peptidoglycan/LPS O-acetylase OafA/YrhL